ncbi:MAG TPA: hypothetical protein VMU62_05105, partial [Acidobacteriaceae bacterium]|nr:hypothetical protein [Acidobacteriaceae bacterium]
MKLVSTAVRFSPAILLLTAAMTVSLAAQTSRAAASSSGAAASDALAEDMLALDGPELPQRGFNASAAFSGLHDSQLGWAGFVQPAVSYRFNHIFSADATIPIYFYRKGYKYRPNNLATGPLTTQTDELGDTIISGHAEFSPGWLDYAATASINAPTGDQTYGLSTGRVTYLLNNDFETTFGSFTPDIQLGIGDSSDLVNRRVTRNYDTLGTLAYFQAGGTYSLPIRMDLESDLYEQLPLGSQKIYTQVIRKKKKRIVQKSNGNAEDNGITVSTDIPTGHHLDISSYYNR